MQEDGDEFEFTKRMVRPDGEVRHVRCVGRPSSGVSEVQIFVGTGIDVTEEELLTRALRKSETELKQMLDLAPQMVCVQGPQHERLYANRQALQYFGLTLEDWLQSNHWSLFHPHHLDAPKTHVARPFFFWPTA